MDSNHLDKIIANHGKIAHAQVVFIDINSYSKRSSAMQLAIVEKFMELIRKTLTEFSKEFIDYSDKNKLSLSDSIIKVQTGDGALLIFPFESINNAHLSFSKKFLSFINKNNSRKKCPQFSEFGWCDCHPYFNVSIGAAEGQLIIFKDLNNAYNAAGTVINLAARIMGLAGCNGLLFSEEAFNKIIDIRGARHLLPRFRKYENIAIKHGFKINAYQFSDPKTPYINFEDLIKLPLATQIADVNQSIEIKVVAPKYCPKENAPSTATTIDPELEKIKAHMARIPGDTYEMGDQKTGTVQVKIEKFLINRYLVSKELFIQIMGSNVNVKDDKSENMAVIGVSWFAAVSFCNNLSAKFRLDEAYYMEGSHVIINYESNGFRLPTEAEWEYASHYKIVHGENNSVDVARQLSVANKSVAAVWEWCNDWFRDKYNGDQKIDSSVQKPPSKFRTLRGGAVNNLGNSERLFSRFRDLPESSDFGKGFRIVLPWSE